jgi:hypothetical protein
MANNLYLGTALTRDLKVDNSGQDALLDIAKSGAAQRLADKAAKEKEIGDLSKEVAKNVIWKSSTTQPRNQATEKKIVEESIASIIEGVRTGESTVAEAYASMNKAGAKLNAVRQYDAQQTAEFTKLSTDAQKWGGLRAITIKGVEYPNIAAAYNDPLISPQELSEALGTTEIASVKNEVLGEEVAQFNFREREVLETAIDRLIGTDKTGFNVDTGKPDKFRLGDKSIQQNWLGLSPEAKEAVYKETLTDPIFDSISDDLSKTDPELRNGSDEKYDKILEVHKQRFDNYIDSKKVKGNAFEYTPRAPKATNPTGVDALFDVGRTPQVTHGHRGTSTGGTSYEYLPKGSKSKVTKVTTLPTGTVMVTSTGDIEAGSATDDYYTAEGATKKVTQAEVAPWRMTYSGGELWFDYSAEDGTYYAVPLTVGSYRDWANRTGEKETPEVVLERAKSLTKNDASIMSQVSKFHKDLYGDGDDEFDPTNF